MTREAIFDVVLKHLRSNVDGLEDTAINGSHSMVDYGASSLDIVEVVSGAMRELKIRVPRTALAELRNIDELVDLFEKTASSGSS